MSVFQLKDFDQCCRCCLMKSRQLESLFGVHLDEMLSEILNVKVEINDGYPAQMCINCIRKMTMAVNFKRLVLASYKKLTDIIKNSNNTVNNGIEDNTIDFSDEEKQVVTINDNSDINHTDKVEDLNNETAEGETCHSQKVTVVPRGKWFKWRTSLLKHSRTHDGRLFRCRVCASQYADSSYLRIHERKHSREDGKPVACRQCGSRFADSNSLKRHEARSHPRCPPAGSRAGAASPRGNAALRPR